MGRKLMVAGNWKMNKNLMEALTLASQVITKAKKMSGTVEIVLAPPFPYLHTINSMSKDLPHVRVAAQDCHSQENGAYTGNVSASMLASMNLSYVILGHSERRKYHNESDALIEQKVSAAIVAGLDVIFCCGEPLSIREAGTHKEFVLQQLKASLFHLNPAQMKQVVIAYEPIWAIGTGQTATAEQAQEMHAFIRKSVSEQYQDALAEQCTILYGGSCNPSNASALFANQDVDGGLVGGASLKVEQFLQIIQAR
jgi:triosephosphate isomerase